MVNVACTHGVKRDVVEIFVQIFLVADYMVEKSGLPEMLVAEECGLKSWPVS
jgi:hypothetical protein